MESSGKQTWTAYYCMDRREVSKKTRLKKTNDYLLRTGQASLLRGEEKREKWLEKKKKLRHRRWRVSGDSCFTSSPSVHQQKHDSNRKHKSLWFSHRVWQCILNLCGEKKVNCSDVQYPQASPSAASEKPKQWIFPPQPHTLMLSKLWLLSKKSYLQSHYSLCTSDKCQREAHG